MKHILEVKFPCTITQTGAHTITIELPVFEDQVFTEEFCQFMGGELSGAEHDRLVEDTAAFVTEQLIRRTIQVRPTGIATNSKTPKTACSPNVSL